MLYLVPTPIGNLEDMTFRAIDTLQTVDVILTEDTRTSGRLLKHFNIDKPLWAFHAYNEHKALMSILDHLKSGKKMALISDAGTPGISDPGYLLVRACHEHNIQVTCLPGPNALIPAIVASGMTTDRFIFEGFLPHKKGRQSRWKAISNSDCTIILYESSHRILKCLEEIIAYLGPDRKICVCREISKLYEEFRTLKASEALVHYTKHPAKGEIVIVIEGVEKEVVKKNKYVSDSHNESDGK
jgi:16S rRNA (cytidine1402-2'-O)-methyltransferase